MKEELKELLKECQKKELHVESAERMSLTIPWRRWGVIGGFVAVLFCLFFTVCKKKKKKELCKHNFGTTSVNILPMGTQYREG